MTRTSKDSATVAPRVQVVQISCRISDDFADNYAFTRYGVNVAVVLPNGDPVWEREVWQRGVWLPFRPFYERRLARAKRKGLQIAESLGAVRPVPAEGSS